MKKLTTLLILTFVSSSLAFGQSKLSENDIVGTWKMVIELDEAMDELRKEAEESETILTEVLLKSVSGIVEGVMNKVQIYFEFKKGGKAVVMVKAFDENSKDEYTRWYIKSGRLYIDESDKFQTDKEEYWYMSDGVLFLDDDDNDQAKIYMVRVKD